MKVKVLLILSLSFLLTCRYRYQFGIYIPMQVGVIYSYTPRYIDNGEYWDPVLKDKYRSDTLYILGDTTINGIPGRKVYVRKQAAYAILRDTSIFYISNDTLIAVGKTENLLVPKFYFNYSGGLYMGEPEYDSNYIVTKLLYTNASVGDRWDVGEFSARLKIYREGFDTIPDSIKSYTISGRVYAEMKGYEDLNLPYGKAHKCALVVYSISMSIGVLPVEFEAFKTWWCDGIGQSAYLMTATQYRNERKARLELADVDFRAR